MDLFNLRAKLTLDVEDYEKKIDNAKEKGKDFSDKTEKQIGIISADAWTSLAGKVIDVAKKIAQASLETLNYADNIGDMAGKWGFTTKEIQEFDYWATMNGTTLESLLTGMRGLVNQAEAGANAFKVLGVNVKNNDGTLKGQKQLFLETLDALQKIPNQTQRNALQFEIFGRAGIELGQVIGRSTEELEELTQQAEEFGIILDEKTINSAGDFNDVLDRLKLQGKTAFAGLITGAEDGQQKFDEFLKNITYAIEMLTPKFYEIGGKLGMSLIEGFGKYLIDRLWGILKWSVGEGWLWGDKPTDNFFGNYFQSMWTVSGGLFDNTPTTSIFESQSNMSSANDNSTTNVTVNMTSTGYTSEDARNLANEVIKEIATKKQASGR
jgi:hypothetical protein